MKYFIYFLLILLSFSTFSQEKLTALKIKNYKDVFNDTLSSNIYEINKNDLYKLIDANEKKYHLIYVYAWWCKPCVRTLPKVLDEFYNNNEVELYILNIERNNSKYLRFIQNNLKKQYHIKKSTYMISEIYGKKPIKKYDKFIEELYPKHKEYGLGLFLLYNKNLDILYASTYNESKEERISNVIKFTN